MRFNKPVIITITALAAGATALGVATPALAADKPATTQHAVVTIDRAHDSATFTTKKGTFTVNWEAFKNGKRDLVTVHNPDKQLVAAHVVSDKKLEKALSEAAKHPAALRHLWQQHHAKKAAHKAEKTAAKS